MYDGEIWALWKNTKKRLFAVEMRFMKAMTEHIRLNRKRNIEILEELEAEPIMKRFKDYMKKWRDHVKQMLEYRPLKKVWKYTPTGKRSLGQPMRELIRYFIESFLRGQLKAVLPMQNSSMMMFILSSFSINQIQNK